MPLDPVTASLVVGGAQLVGQGANAYAQGKMNKKTRQWNEKMFDRQNQRDLDYWNLQNSYNSPEQQMDRLRKAGLNPHLIYGHGADATASPVPTSGVASWNPRAPEVDLGRAASDSLGAYFNTATREAQTDNLKAQNDVLLQDATLKAMQTAQTAASTAKTKQETQQSSELFGISLEAAKANVQKTVADTTYTLSENERRTLQTSSSLQEAAERILKSRSDRATSAVERIRIAAAIRDIQNSAELKQLDIDLKKNGINPNDPMYQRILGRAINSVGGNLSDAAKDSWEWIKDKFKK